MGYKDLASISGKSCLFKVIKPIKSGLILESLDDKKNRFIANSIHKVSILGDISIYMAGQEESVPLPKIFHAMHKKYKGNLEVDSNSSNEKLSAFLNHLLSNHDTERVYISDIKKIVNWYKIIFQYAEELLKIEEPATESTDK